ncbi:MAG: putative esterase [Bacteriovoracaceae bacterium]|jgi:predicted esterase
MKIETKVHKFFLDYEGQQINALAFVPEGEIPSPKALAVFSHGYSSHKGSLLNWPIRLAEEGMPSVIFDLPGHYLGGFSEALSFESFKLNSPKLFLAAFEKLKSLTNSDPSEVVLGGHSLGASFALMASKLEEFKDVKQTIVCVGLGQLPVGAKHLFTSAFYKSTLSIRSQLVSKELHPDRVFPWINQMKRDFKITGKRIHFITGADDLVVGEGGSERMMENLKTQGNVVSLDLPPKLAHHQPELAASFIKKFLKKEGFFS